MEQTFWKVWCCVVAALWTTVSAMEMLEEESDYSDWTMTSQYRGLQRSYKNCQKFSYRPSGDGCNKCICFADRWICAKEPCSENIGCTDFYSECKRYKEQAGCTRYWMKKICPKTCGACSTAGTNSPICKDMSTKCTKWAVQGKCSKGRIYWKCKATCACGSGSNPCEDTHSKCQKWASEGKCGIKKVFKKCKSSCPCDLPCKCGIPNRKNIDSEIAPRIIGGDNVAFPRKYPWQVSLQQKQKHKCGGSIINDRWILTAAHCFVVAAIDLAIVGEHALVQTVDNSRDTRSYGIKQYITHPKFDFDKEIYDFALLELREPIPFNDVIRPICLPEDDSKNYVGETGTVIAWGRVDGNLYLFANILQEVNLKINANTDCQKWNTDKYSGPIPSDQMCAGVSVNRITCVGDSGGPLFVYEKNRAVQVGIVSYGGDDVEGYPVCQVPGFPTIFARVTTVLEWINITTTNGKKCVN